MSASNEFLLRTHAPVRPAWVRTLVVTAAGGSALLGLWLAVHYPLSALAAVTAWLALAGLAFARPAWGLVVLLALLPVSGLAPWTGWLIVEELDLGLLALAAGGYARLSRSERSPPRPGVPLVSGLLIAAAVFVLLLSTLRGVEDAGGWAFGWWQAYHQPLNSLRLAKPLLMVLAIWPLWQAIDRGASRHALLAWGMTAGLALASLSVLAERHAFVGLSNFSTDYRAVGPFWEMHIGGAALDAYLALALPFAVMLVGRTERALPWAVAALTTALAAYASLATFSRGVYLAVPLGLLVLWWRERHRDRAVQGTLPAAVSAAGGVRWALLAGFAAAAVWMFPTSGYRGLLAAWGVVALMLFVAEPLHRLDGSARRRVALLALPAIAAVLLCAWVLPKGVYWAYAITALLASAAAARLAWPARSPAPAVARVVALTAYIALLPAAALVAGYWGGLQGWLHALPVLLAALLTLVWAGTRTVPAWPARWQWQLGWAGALGLVGLATAVLMGGARMSERFATVEQDWEGRVEHWRAGLRLMSSWDMLVGKGQGRFAASLYAGGDEEARVGDHRLVVEDGAGYLRLSGGRHVLDWGEVYRMSQRLDPTAVPVALRLKARAEQATSLHVDVCAKRLLYDDGCVIGKHTLKLVEPPGTWQQVQMPLSSRPLDAGVWWAPRPIVFSIAVASRGAALDLDELSLLDASGRELLRNGDFSAGLTRWFFSSDRHHLPWHIKSLPLHVLFDQGLLGLIVHTLLAVGALWRVTVGSARGHPLAPPLAAALVGFLAIGLFDSVVDAPRIAFVYYLLLVLALTLPHPPRRGAAAITHQPIKKRRRRRV